MNPDLRALLEELEEDADEMACSQDAEEHAHAAGMLHVIERVRTLLEE